MKTNPKSLQNLKKFKKGVSGNLLGGKLHNPEIKKLKNLTEAELIEVGTLVVKGSLDELRAIAEDGKQSALKCMIAGVAVRTIKKGDPAALNALLDRLIGKVKEKVEHTGIPSQQGPQVFVTLPSNGREAKLDGKD